MDDSDSQFEKAVALARQGKHREAIDIFLGLANNTDNLFEKAEMLINAAHAFKEIEQFDLARNQLAAVRGLLHLPSHVPPSTANDAIRSGLLINLELEDARISAGEQKLEEALDKLNLLLTTHRSDLLKPNFAVTYQTVRRDRAFLLADSGHFEEALPELEDLDSREPHDPWILFNLGYCYRCTARYSDAQRKLEEAIKAGLNPDFEGRAHCILGASCYELGEYTRAKLELEIGVQTAAPRYLKGSRIWRLLEYTCISLGLKAEAEYYASLDKGASQPS
jgi:tetratricopeptide (TPR) repeat protein